MQYLHTVQEYEIGYQIILSKVHPMKKILEADFMHILTVSVILHSRVN